MLMEEEEKKMLRLFIWSGINTTTVGDGIAVQLSVYVELDHGENF